MGIARMAESPGFDDAAKNLVSTCSIDNLAHRAGLTGAEEEVFRLLAKGHSLKQVETQLHISEGTAKTHIRHIYRKLDIHSQQDLMRLVESASYEE